jgi:hypothetical protein
MVLGYFPLVVSCFTPYSKKGELHFPIPKSGGGIYPSSDEAGIGSVKRLSRDARIKVTPLILDARERPADSEPPFRSPISDTETNMIV